MVSISQAHEGQYDCYHAEADLNRLKHEKLSTAERIEKGATSIIPIGLVFHIAKGTEKKNLHMSMGDYNKKIDERIADIKKQCGIE